jgi:hypothetical protein
MFLVEVTFLELVAECPLLVPLPLSALASFFINHLLLELCFVFVMFA